MEERAAADLVAAVAALAEATEALVDRDYVRGASCTARAAELAGKAGRTLGLLDLLGGGNRYG